MESNNQSLEKRTYERYRVKQGVYATLNLDDTKIGQLVNISRGGFAFQYIDNGTPAEKEFESNVFLSSENEYVHNIPFKTVSDIKVTSKDFVTVRQCGVQFGKLSPEQMIQLDSFIWDSIVL